jgi:DtxR family Mn-dependent transcriptional regulator
MGKQQTRTRGSRSAEMYLKTICELADGGLVAISLVADRLDVSAVSASEMVKRLVDQGLVAHEPYKGVGLTDEGQRQAVHIIRRHRLWEYFLVEHLALPWEVVHEQACRLEHAADERVTEALAAYMGNPSTCPHGNPIPDLDGELSLVSTTPLSHMAVGDQGRVERITQEGAELLDYLAQHDIYPDQMVEVEDIAPFEGPLTVRVGKIEHVLGRAAADHVLVAITSERPHDD